MWAQKRGLINCAHIGLDFSNFVGWETISTSVSFIYYWKVKIFLGDDGANISLEYNKDFKAVSILSQMSEPKPDLEQCAIMEELGRLDPNFDKNQPVYLLSPAYLEEIGEDDYSLIRFQGVRDDVFVPTSEAIRRRLNEGPNKFCRVVAYHTQDRKLKFELVKVDGPDSRVD